MRRGAVYVVRILIVLLLLTPVVYVQVNKILYANRVAAYLTDIKCYTKEEISAVKGVWSIKAPPFLVQVEFRDEPGGNILILPMTVCCSLVTA